MSRSRLAEAATAICRPEVTRQPLRPAKVLVLTFATAELSQLLVPRVPISVSLPVPSNRYSSEIPISIFGRIIKFGHSAWLGFGTSSNQTPKAKFAGPSCFVAVARIPDISRVVGIGLAT